LTTLIPHFLWKKRKKRFLVVSKFIPTLQSFTYQQAWSLGIEISPSLWEKCVSTPFHASPLIVIEDERFLTRVPVLDIVRSENSITLTEESIAALEKYIEKFPPHNNQLIYFILRKAQDPTIFPTSLLNKWRENPKYAHPAYFHPKKTVLTPYQKVLMQIDKLVDRLENVSINISRALSKELFEKYIQPYSWQDWFPHKLYNRIAAVCVYKALKLISRAFSMEDFYSALSFKPSIFHTTLFSLSHYFPSKSKLAIIQNIIRRECDRHDLSPLIYEHSINMLNHVSNQFLCTKPECAAGGLIAYTCIKAGNHDTIPLTKIAKPLAVSPSSISFRVKKLAKLEGYRNAGIHSLCKKFA
jgi:hypothetical protein